MSQIGNWEVGINERIKIKCIISVNDVANLKGFVYNNSGRSMDMNIGFDETIQAGCNISIYSTQNSVFYILI